MRHVHRQLVLRRHKKKSYQANQRDGFAQENHVAFVVVAPDGSVCDQRRRCDRKITRPIVLLALCFWKILGFLVVDDAFVFRFGPAGAERFCIFLCC